MADIMTSNLQVLSSYICKFIDGDFLFDLQMQDGQNYNKFICYLYAVSPLNTVIKSSKSFDVSYN